MPRADHRLRSRFGLVFRAGGDLRPLWVGVSLWLFLAATLLAGAPRASALALAAVAFLLGVAFFRPLSEGTNPSIFFFFGFALWTSFSALPLPCGVVRALAPGVGQIWADAFGPLRAPPVAHCALSVAPAATIQGALNLSSYAVVALASGVVARRIGLWAVLLSVFGVAVFVALLTLVHGLLGLEHLLGWSILPAKSAYGPASVIVNPNNLAGYMNVGVFSGLGLLASRHPPIPRGLLAVGSVVCIATLILTASRGGTLALGFGILASVVLFALRRFSRSRRVDSELVRQAPLLLLVVAAGVLVALLGANPDIERALFGGDASKVRQLGALATTLDQVDWTGVGRGAFDSVSARFMHEGRNFTHEYAENFVLSWLIEWGPVVGGLALLCLGWFLFPGRLALRGHPSAEFAWLGLVVVLLQNFGDLGLELPGLAGAFVAIGAALEGSRGRRGRVTPALSGARTTALGCVLVLVLAAAVWTAVTGPTLGVTRARTHTLVERALGEKSDKAERGAAWRAIESGLGRFPAEPYFALVAGWLTLREGGDAMSWAAEALRRAPGSARANLLVAEVLALRGATDQALLHVRRAVEADPPLMSVLAKRAVALTSDGARLEAAVPGGVTGGRFLMELVTALPRGADARSRRHLLGLAAIRAPDDARIQAALGLALLDDVRRGSAPCPLEAAVAACPVAADARERILSVAAKTENAPACDGLRLRAALLAYEQRGQEALELLTACPSCTVPLGCAKDRVELALDQGDEEARRLALGAFRATTCDTSARCADAEAWLAGSFERRAQPNLALVHAFRAAEVDPSAERYLAAARVARQAGRADRVEFALARARRLGGKDPELDRWLEQHRAVPEISK